MCGRYTNNQMIRAMIVQFAAETQVTDQDWTPDCQVLPTTKNPVVVQDRSRRLGLMRWGWLRDRGVASEDRRADLHLNARSETMATKPTWRDAVQRRRCIIPATGWWETRRDDGTPKGTIYHHRLNGGAGFAFAGLWTKDGDQGRYVLVTTHPAASIAYIHDRQPVVLLGDAVDRWLDPTTDLPGLQAICQPPPDALLQAYPVARFGSRDHGTEILGHLVR